MGKSTNQPDAILLERFGKDSIIALATAVDNIPYVRSVDAFYEDGSFYVLTHGLSGKMKQIGFFSRFFYIICYTFHRMKAVFQSANTSKE